MKFIRTAGYLLAGTFLLMIIALYNGYPLIWADAGAYIVIGCENIIPNDRSPFYGYFLRMSSMLTSLWFTLFVQCLLLAYLLIEYVKTISGIAEKRFALICTILITAFTAVSWIVGAILPDIFIAITVLATLVYLQGNNTIAKKAWLIIIIFFSVILHNSHFLILGLFSGCLFVYALIKKYYPLLRKSIVLMIIAIAGLSTLCLYNFENGNGWVISKGADIFTLTKMAETGVLKRYLARHCGEKNYKLCAYKNDIPVYSWDFMWDPNSPLNKTGGWDSNKVEHREIIQGIYSDPECYKYYIKSCVTGTLRQLTQIYIPEKFPINIKGTPHWIEVKDNFEEEINEFTSARQNSGEGLSAEFANSLNLCFLIFSTLFILFMYRKMEINEQQRFIYAALMIVIIINAFVTSVFSTVVHRLHNRIFWLLPATNAIMIAKYIWKKITEKEYAL